MPPGLCHDRGLPALRGPGLAHEPVHFTAMGMAAWIPFRQGRHTPHKFQALAHEGKREDSPESLGGLPVGVWDGSDPLGQDYGGVGEAVAELVVADPRRLEAGPGCPWHPGGVE